MNTKYWIGLSSIEQLDSNFIRRIYNYFGDIETAFKAKLSDLKQVEGLSVRKAEVFLGKKKELDLDKTLDEVQRRGIEVITFDNPKYPYMLKQISDPPVCLYYKGDLFSCNLEKTVAFVGSRRASLNGKNSIKKIIAGLRNTDICVVSGLASGIDAASHQSAISNNIKTIGVIASGFDYTYPASNKHLYEEIENGGGAVVTEYYPTFEPMKFRFPQRNRIVTGLSYGTVVGEAALKSGALISANLTLEQGRELMCIPGAINNANTEGIYKLIKDGATIVTSAEDILNALNWQIEKLPQEQSELSQMSNDEKTIYKMLEIEPKDFDEIQAQTNLETGNLLSILTMMEIKGLIENIEGDKYKRV